MCSPINLLSGMKTRVMMIIIMPFGYRTSFLLLFSFFPPPFFFGGGGGGRGTHNLVRSARIMNSLPESNTLKTALSGAGEGGGGGGDSFTFVLLARNSVYILVSYYGGTRDPTSIPCKIYEQKKNNARVLSEFLQ